MLSSFHLNTFTFILLSCTVKTDDVNGYYLITGTLYNAGLPIDNAIINLPVSPRKL